MMAETEALAAIGTFQENLRGGVRQFALDQPFGLQLYGALWTHLCGRLGIKPSRDLIEVEPPAHVGIHTTTAGTTSADLIHQILQEVPPFARLIFTFQLITGLSASRLAELTGVSEATVRASRAAVLLHVHEALTR